MFSVCGLALCFNRLTANRFRNSTDVCFDAQLDDASVCGAAVLCVALLTAVELALVTARGSSPTATVLRADMRRGSSLLSATPPLLGRRRLFFASLRGSESVPGDDEASTSVLRVRFRPWRVGDSGIPSEIGAEMAGVVGGANEVHSDKLL
jgi:hypothetical protein